MKLTQLARTTTGQLFVVPWEQRIVPLPVTTTLPSISGTVAPGQTVTAVAGVYTGTSVARVNWEWTRYNAAGAVIDTSEGPTYAIPSNAVTGRLVLLEHVLDAYGRAPSPTPTASASITAVAGLPTFTRAPAISGSATVGSTLTVVDGAATGSPVPTISRQWYRGTTAISGAIDLTYVTVTADIGSAITCVNTATSGTNTATSTSTSVTPASPEIFTGRGPYIASIARA